jgi:capsular exopolysaccharide synthesis family protein
MTTALLANGAAGIADRPATDRRDGDNLLRILMRRRWIVLATVLAMTGAAALFAFMWPPTYRATSSLIISSPADDARLPSGTGGLASLDDRLIDSQVELLNGRPVLRQVVEKLGLYNDREFGAAEGAAERGPPSEAAIEKAADILRKKIVARRIDRSAVISITAQTHAPGLSADIANAMAETHVAQQRSAAMASKQQSIDRVLASLVSLQAQAIDADRAVTQYRRLNDMLGVSDGSDVGDLSQLSGALAEARIGRSTATARADGGTPMVVGAASPLLADLQRQAADVGKRIAEMSTIYDQGYPALAGLKAQLQDINARIDSEVARANAALRAEAAIAATRERQIANDIDRMRREGFQKRAASVKLLDLERIAAATNAQYVATLNTLQLLEAEAGNAKVPARVLAQAAAPKAAHFPKRRETIIVAFAASWLIGILLALAIEQLRDNRIRTAVQIDQLIGVPTLGMLPTSADAAMVHRLLIQHPRSVLSEAVRSLYLNVRQQLPDTRSRVLLVTSPLPGEGKSTVAMSLATAAMTLRTKVVLIDFDLRHPQLLVDNVAAAGRPDLVDYLDGDATIADALIRLPEMSGLAVLGAKRPAADPTALLASPRLAELFADLRRSFQFIVINTPPILAVRDARTLAALADGTLLVVRWGETRYDTVRSAANAFGGPFVGAVINRVDYERHAKAAFGDEIQHYATCSGYYLEGPPARGEHAVHSV